MPGAPRSSSAFIGRVGRAEVNHMAGDVLDAAAGADGLVVDLNAGLLLVFLEPFQVQRGGKGRAGPVEVLRLCRNAAENGKAERGQRCRL